MLHWPRLCAVLAFLGLEREPVEDGVDQLPYGDWPAISDEMIAGLGRGEGDYESLIAAAAERGRAALVGFRFCVPNGRHLSLVSALRQAQNGDCPICREPLGRKKSKLSIDHVRPRHNGGGNIGNRLLTHHQCNHRKGGRWPMPHEIDMLNYVNARLLGDPAAWHLISVPPLRDRDGTEGGDANAAPVPQDRQARAEGIAQSEGR